MSLAESTILITGGATGIGLAMARRLVADGARVIACGRREDALSEAARSVPGLVVRRCDVTEAADRDALAEWLAAEVPGLNVLVNNAGVQRPLGLTRPLDPAVVEGEIATNLTAPILLTSRLLPQLMRATAPMIVNVSSGLGFCPMARTPVYSATKAALHAYTLSLRWQLRASGVRVVELIPPLVASDLKAGAPAEPQGGPPMMPADVFVAEALARLQAGEDEIAVGVAAGLHEKRDALFAAINR